MPAKQPHPVVVPSHREILEQALANKQLVQIVLKEDTPEAMVALEEFNGRILHLTPLSQGHLTETLDYGSWLNETALMRTFEFSLDRSFATDKFLAQLGDFLETVELIPLTHADIMRRAIKEQRWIVVTWKHDAIPDLMRLLACAQSGKMFTIQSVDLIMTEAIHQSKDWEFDQNRRIRIKISGLDTIELFLSTFARNIASIQIGDKFK